MLRKWRFGVGLIFTFGLVLAITGAGILTVSAWTGLTSVSTTVFSASGSAWAGTETAPASAYDTAVVVPVASTTKVTGTVTYTFYRNGNCNENGTSAGTKTITATGLVPKSDTEPDLAAGSYSFKATYSGDTIYAVSTSACEPFSVTAAPPPTKTNVNLSTIVFDAATSKALIDLKLPAGGSVYDTSKVVAPSAIPAPTGTISYMFWSNGECDEESSGAGTGLALGTNSSTKGPLEEGNYSFKATYSGDSHYNGTTSVCEPFSVTAAPPPTKTDVNLSTIVFDDSTNVAWAGTEQTGASAYDTSKVVGPSAIPVPTGTVTFTFYTNISCTGDGSSAGTKTLSASGTVPKSDTMSNLAAGSYAFKATYNGDTRYNAKTSACEPFSVAAAQETGTTTPSPTGGVEAATATPTGGVLAATGGNTPDQGFGLFLVALGLITIIVGAFAWRRREA